MNKSRRVFLQLLLTSFLLSACQRTKKLDFGTFKPPTAKQLENRNKQISKVAVIESYKYDEAEILENLKKYIQHFPNLNLENKTVILKPNMVDYWPGKVISTNAIFLASVISLCEYLQAKDIIVAEGSGNFRDTEFVLGKTGIGDVCKSKQVKFVDLNIDDIEPVDNPDGFSGINPFYLPKTILNADVIISLPKMKCHHWALLTASMKNFFGIVPGKKYGWPKNLLHHRGIPQCIIDLVLLAKPHFAIVDGILAMEGDGPLNGDTVEANLIIMGDDLASVDATCARVMELELDKIPYLAMAGSVIGNIDNAQIEIIGSPIAKVKKAFKRPITYINSELLSLGKNQSS